MAQQKQYVNRQEEHPAVELLEKVADQTYFPEREEIEAHIESCELCRFSVCIYEAASVDTAHSPQWRV